MVDNLFIQENIGLRDYTTLKLGGEARYFGTVTHKEDLPKYIEFAKSLDVPVFPLGGGSNIVVKDEIAPMLFLKMENKGIEILKESGTLAYIQVSAGVEWDRFVEYSVQNDFSGIEALSLIPGTVGATPVQNVNAYGAEVASVIDSIRFYNIPERKFETIDSDSAQFGYRDSVFKNALKGKAIIESIVFKLQKNEPAVPDYPRVAETIELIKKEKDLPLLSLIREAVILIRSEKLPDPKIISNVGSFFTNPIVEKEVVERMAKEYADLRYFEVEEKYKIPAGWLIEKAGFKGHKENGVGVYPKHALVLINYESKCTEDLLRLASKIQDNIYSKFGIKLEIEPEIV